MKKIISLLALSMIFISCERDDDQDVLPKIDRTEIKDFIWKGLNKYYLWQEEVSDLADDRFAPNVEQTTLANPEYAEFLAVRTAKNLFNELLEHGKDYYSAITTDYTRWEMDFEGKIFSAGMELASYKHINREQYAVVLYVLPNSTAEQAGVKRGDIISKVDGVRITQNNFSSLFYNDKTSTTIDINKIQEISGVEQIVQVRTDVSLGKSQITENPILVKRVFNISSKKIGYLMYNSFNSNFDVELNQAFADFKAEGVNEFVLDLRYNTGGEVQTAIRLSSMLTGQFTGELFSKEVWNKKIEPEVIRTKGIENFFIDKFTQNGVEHTINNLNLSKLYVLTSSETASASELLINSLSPYIQVIQIGQKTKGKNQASIEVYDEDQNGVRNPNHKWAMLPMAVKHENKDGFGDFHEGISPESEDIYDEDFTNLGQLGDRSEPMLDMAINKILGLSPEKDDAPLSRPLIQYIQPNPTKSMMRQ